MSDKEKAKALSIAMQRGESLFNDRNQFPVIHIQPGGPRTYLWIGQELHGGCYATLSGPKTLEKLAMRILKELGHKVKLS